MRHSRARSVAAATGLGVVLLAAGAPAAGAHGSGGQPIPDAKHYLARIEGFTPAVAGVTATVDPRGEWIDVTNVTGKTLTIFGYAHEPYLQIGPQGVQQNDLAVSVQLNQSLFGDLSQLGFNSQLPPVWRTTAATNHVRWHDHRIHWMSPQRPPRVAAHPGRAQLIGQWTVHLQLSDQRVNINGTLSWLPVKQSPFLSIGLILDIALSVAVAVGVGGYVLYRRHRNQAPEPDPPVPTIDPLLDLTDPGDDPDLASLARRRARVGDHNRESERMT
jgi:hypothetical protein